MSDTNRTQITGRVDGSLRDRIAAVLNRHKTNDRYDEWADAELRQEWRADFGYDGYANCDTREDLRDRIAEVLKAAAEKRGIYKIADFDFPFLADAVIRELGLRQEVDDKAAFRMEASRHRYVTEWGNDE